MEPSGPGPDELRWTLRGLRVLPLLAIDTRLVAPLADPDLGGAELGALIERSPSVAARVVGCSRSAYLGTGSAPCSVPAAIEALGPRLARALALDVIAFADGSALDRCPAFDAERYQAHARVTAAVCRRIAQAIARGPSPVPPPDPGCAYLCGLLHGVGRLALVQVEARVMASVLEAARDQPGRPLAEIELQHLGVSHRDAGAWLAASWQLPAEVRAAIEHHHRPGCAGEHASYASIVGLAAGWCDQRLAGVQAPRVAAEFLDGLGLPRRRFEQCVTACEPMLEELRDSRPAAAGSAATTAPCSAAAREMHGRFYALLDSLSALRGLAANEPGEQSARDLPGRALDLLMEYEDCSEATVYRHRDGVLVPAATRHRAGVHAAEDVRAAQARLAEACAQRRRVTRADGAGHESAATGRVSSGGAMACTPMLSRGELLGVLAVRAPTAAASAPWQEHATLLFCTVLASMLDGEDRLDEAERALVNRGRELDAALREVEQLERRNEQVSGVDELTTLHNRRFFCTQTEAALARSLRYGHGLSLLLAEVDGFERYGDTHGRDAADRLLRDIAEELRRETRGGDIIARFGADTFAVALPATAVDGARLLASRIRASVEALAAGSAGAAGPKVTLSLGVGHLAGRRARDPGALLAQVLREADQALYAARADGGNCVRVVGAPGTAGEGGEGGVDAPR